MKVKKTVLINQETERKLIDFNKKNITRPINLSALLDQKINEILNKEEQTP